MRRLRIPAGHNSRENLEISVRRFSPMTIPYSKFDEAGTWNHFLVFLRWMTLVFVRWWINLRDLNIRFTGRWATSDVHGEPISPRWDHAYLYPNWFDQWFYTWMQEYLNTSNEVRFRKALELHLCYLLRLGGGRSRLLVTGVCFFSMKERIRHARTSRCSGKCRLQLDLSSLVPQQRNKIDMNCHNGHTI